jgi:hypothetical protein
MVVTLPFINTAMELTQSLMVSGFADHARVDFDQVKIFYPTTLA